MKSADGYIILCIVVVFIFNSTSYYAVYEHSPRGINEM